MSSVLLPGTAGASLSGPAYPGDFPDPSVLLVGQTYYAYSTQTPLVNIGAIHSTDLVHWSPLTDALPNPPTWGSGFTNGGATWAPSVVKQGKSYLLYYSVHDNAANRMCISVASASAPSGPFTDNSGGPLVCQLDHGGSIDPNVFTDVSGTRYLIWKSDDGAIGQPSHLWGQRLNPNGHTLAGSPVDLLDAAPFQTTWEDGVIEGPSMQLSGGTYYLFYGGNHWDQSTSAIGYATCSRPLGPCTKVSTNSPWFATNSQVVGPQGPSFFTDVNSQPRMAFDSWTCAPNNSCPNGPVGYSNGGARSLWQDTITFPGGQPALGP